MYSVYNRLAELEEFDPHTQPAKAEANLINFMHLIGEKYEKYNITDNDLGEYIKYLNSQKKEPEAV